MKDPITNLENPILIENEQKRIDCTLGRLLCFVMFMIWQMGFIYYLGPALVINGETPLAAALFDDTSAVIAGGYIAGILWLIFLPKKFLSAARLTALIALLTSIGILLPLPTSIIGLLLFIQCFCCCFMIGFESATVMYLLSEKAAIIYLLLVYPIGYLIIAIMQNELVMLSFDIFKWTVPIMLVLLLYFFTKLPTDAFPTFARRNPALVLPTKLFAGTYLFIFLSCLLAVIGPAAAAEVKHGVSVTYTFAAIAALFMYFLYKKTALHPLRSVSGAVVLGIIGFVLLYVSLYVPTLSLLACALLGIGFIPCALVPLFGVELMREYPSHLIPAITMICAFISVLIHSSLTEAFKASLQSLYLSYLVIVVVMAMVYLLLEPLLLHSLREKYSYSKDPNIRARAYIHEPEDIPSPFDILTTRELEVTDLISRGYSNGDIARMLFISEHTVKDHTKNIYRKLDVHSRFELAALINRTKD